MNVRCIDNYYSPSSYDLQGVTRTNFYDFYVYRSATPVKTVSCLITIYRELENISGGLGADRI